MWTRYNIAESSVMRTIEKFHDHWHVVQSQLNRLPTEKLAKELGWQDYEAEVSKHEAVFNAWIKDFEAWIESCYPMPEDRLINTGDKICQQGITYNQFRLGLKASESMWKDFASPLLRQYAKMDGFSQELHD